MSHAPREQRVKFSFLALTASLFFVVLLSQGVFAATRTEKNQDIVFLVDTSSSMRDIFDGVKKSIRDYVRQGQPGDNVVIISFAEKVELRIRQRISSDEDVKLIERELDKMEPTGDFTYITAALDRGMEELRTLASKDPTHLRTLVLMSDGKNNPPPDISEPLTFEEVLQRYPGLLKAADSSFYYLSLGKNPDPEVLSFMETVEGSSFETGKVTPETAKGKPPLALAQVFVEPVSIDLGAVFGPKATVTVSLAFFPARGNPSGRAIAISMSSRFRENPSWSTTIEVFPALIDCSAKPWTREIRLKIDSLHEGTLVGTVELKPVEGDALFIEPTEIPVTMMIRQPEMRVVQRESLDFGPIDPRRRFEQSRIITLVPNAAAAGEEIQVKQDIALPEGLTMNTRIERRGQARDIIITVESSDEFQPLHSMVIEGKVRLSGARHVIAFSKNDIEVRIKVRPPAARGRALVGLFSRVTSLLVPVLAVVVGVVVIGLAGYWLLRPRPESAFEGKLVLLHLKGKASEVSRTIAVNLNDIGKTLRRDSLTIGSSTDAGIVLPHKSVAAHHCDVYVSIDEGSKHICIEPVGDNSVIVNMQRIAEPTPLSDKDLVEIGAYTFRFENPHPFKQIVVKFLDGRILKGTPSSWDIDTEGFNLLPRDALPGSEEEIYVRFGDLKAVYFVRDFDGQIGKKIVSPSKQIRGTHLRLTFHDKEVMEGFTSEAYTASSPRFYFFPADQTGNTISLVVERMHLISLEEIMPQQRNA